MPSYYRKPDPFFGSIDLDDEYITNQWVLDQFVGYQMFSMGRNTIGQLGIGSNGNYYSSPVQVGSLTNWKQVSTGTESTLAVKIDGTLWACGSGTLGVLGFNNSTVSYSSPVQVGSLTNWKQVVCNGYSSFAIKNDGTLWSWGSNTFGKLGNGNTTTYSSPVQVGALSTWKQVACSGGDHTAAIKNDGTLWIWGSNEHGQLGTGDTTYYSSPIQVGSLTNWAFVSAGGFHTAAVKTDGTLWTWGYNNFGQLGNGNTTKYSSPVQVGSLTSWKSVALSSYNTFAINGDNSLWVCGYNTNGQLGLGNRTSQTTLQQVGLLTDWKYIFPGYATTLAIKTNGSLWGWGDNTLGQLGIGTNTNKYSSPIQVGSLTNWKQVAITSNSVLAITFADL